MRYKLLDLIPFQQFWHTEEATTKHHSKQSKSDRIVLHQDDKELNGSWDYSIFYIDK